MTILQMKILYGITKSNFGGAQRYVYDLAKSMKEHGHDVSVVCGGEGTLVEKLNDEGIRVITIPGFSRDIDLLNDAPRLLFIIKTLWREKPDVFHINSAKMGGAGIFSGRLLGIKHIVFTAHGWAFNEPRPRWQKLIIKFLTWVTILCAHKTICVSDKMRRDIQKWPFIKNKLEVIYNGISPFALAPREEKEFVVGTTSELHKIKGLDILLKAWSKFRKNRQVKLIIFNDGEERKNLENLAHKLEISDSIDFRGFVDNAREQLLNFDIFCMPSRSEGLPYALLEAGFAARPVIATSVGGIPEIVENGIGGALVPPEDSEALLSSLVLFYDNPRMRDRLGMSLKETVKEKFSLEKMVEETLKVYL